MNEQRLHPTYTRPSSHRDWLPFAILVAALHGLLIAGWLVAPQSQRMQADDSVFEVALAASLLAQAPQPTAPRVTSKAVETVAEQPAALPVESTSAAEQPAAVPDSAPDYRAAYLNNPAPAYPLSARRRGMQGRVVLNVEVLAEGSCGQVSIQQSSGHEVLDQAALQTVKGWRFTPARHLGQAVTRQFLVPITFAFKDDAA